jgi:hypothetical protein
MMQNSLIRIEQHSANSHTYPLRSPGSVVLWTKTC